MWISVIFSVLLLSLIVSGFAMLFVKRNGFIGFRTPLTLSDPYIWEKVNKSAGVLIILIGVFAFILNAFGYAELGSIVGLIGILGIFIFGEIYSKRLAKERKEFYTPEPYIISKSLMYTTILFSILLVLVGVAMLFVPPNSLIGIRISKTLTNPELWRKVNRISGIGFILIGLVFSVLFFKDSSMEPEHRTKNFDNHFLWFVVITILLSFISAGLAYI
jgi:uncharacterized membrane protein